jgi:hypothetical protein
MMDDLLQALQGWYAEQCDGEWENDHGVQILSCDNPGWWVKIDVVGTGLQGRPFERVAEQVDASGFQQGDRWLCCFVKDGIWHGSGDETKLAIILKTFLDWVACNDVSPER